MPQNITGRRGTRIAVIAGRRHHLRYRHRWKVERLFAWRQKFRRLVVRYKFRHNNYFGMVHLDSIIILLRHL